MINLSAYFDQMVVILPQFSQITVTPFKEGFSNNVYRLDWDGLPQLVLRVPALDEKAFFINRASELLVLSSASQAMLSPELLWQNEEGAFASRFVAQPSFEWSVMHTSDDIDRIAKALMATHQLPVVERHYCVYELITHYLTEIYRFLTTRPELVEEYRYLNFQLASLERASVRGTPVLCHNDVNPKNILMDDQHLWLIDWECSGMGDPLFDLAVVTQSHNLNPSQRIELILAYQPSLDIEDTLWCIELYCLAYTLREMTWLLLKHLTTPDDPDALSSYFEFKATSSFKPFLDTDFH